VDPMDHSVWCATDPGVKNRSEIVHFDAQGKLLERYTPTTTRAARAERSCAGRQ